MNGRTPVLGVDVDFGGHETVVSVRGDVDPLSAPTLGAVLSAQIAGARQPPLVLDLAGLTFMDAAGLNVIVGAVNLLAEQSKRLVVRSLPESTRRIMDITGLTEFVTLDPGARVSDEMTSVFADAAAGLLAGASAADDQRAARVREALTIRDHIARAQGVLIARQGFTPLEAAAEMHRSARSADRSVDEAASALLDSTHPLDARSPGGS